MAKKGKQNFVKREVEVDGNKFEFEYVPDKNAAKEAKKAVREQKKLAKAMERKRIDEKKKASQKKKQLKAERANKKKRESNAKNIVEVKPDMMKTHLINMNSAAKKAIHGDYVVDKDTTWDEIQTNLKHVDKVKFEKRGAGRRAKVTVTGFFKEIHKGKVTYILEQPLQAVINRSHNNVRLRKDLKALKIPFRKNAPFSELYSLKFNYLKEHKGTEKFFVLGNASFLKSRIRADETKQVGDVKIKKTVDTEIITVPIRFSKGNTILTLPKGYDYRTQDGQDTAIEEIIKRLSEQENPNAPNYYTLLGVTFELLKYTPTDLKDVKMKGTKLIYQLLTKACDRKIKQQDGTCVIDYIYDEVKGLPRFLKYTKDLIIHEFTQIAGDITEGISTDAILKWAKEKHPNISVYAVDPMMQVFAKQIANSQQSVLQLVFVVNNSHLYPITKREVKHDVAKKLRLDLSEYLTDFKFKIEHGDEGFKFIDDNNKLEFAKGALKGDIFYVKDEDISLKMLCNLAIASTNDISVMFKPKSQGGFSGFTHPTTGQVVCEAYDFDERKKVCDKLYEKYPIEQFKFRNQTFTEMIKVLLNVKVGLIQKNRYNSRAKMVMHKFGPKALIQTVIDLNEKSENFITKIDLVDRTKAYSSFLYNNKERFPIYSIHDDIKVFNGTDKITIGEYYIDPIKLKSGIVIGGCFLMYFTILKLIKKGIIKRTDIKYVLKASFALPADLFRELVAFVFTEFGTGNAKEMINCLTGSFRQIYERKHKFCLTSCWHTINALTTEHNVKNKRFTLDYLNSDDDKHENVMLFRSFDEDMSEETYLSLYNFIICKGYDGILDVLEEVEKESEIIGVNTDCIYYINKKGKKYGEKMSDNVLENLGKLRNRKEEENVAPKAFKEINPELFKLEDHPLVQGEGEIIEGKAGLGKTHTLLEKVKDLEKNGERYIIFSYTNKAVSEINDRYNKGRDNYIPIARTFDSFLNEQNGEEKNIDLLKNRVIIVDEYTMAKNYFMSIIYQSFVKNMNKVYLFGNIDQLPEIGENGVLPVNYLESPAIRQMCPNLRVLEWHDKARQTNNDFSVFSRFAKTGDARELKKLIKKTGNFKKNVCKLNETRKKIINKYAIDGIMMDFKYQNFTEKYKVKVGDSLFATANMKPLGIFNNCIYTIKSISEGNVTLNNGVMLPKVEFAKSFIPAYCATTNKYQGETISDNYNIFDASLMSRNDFYVAITRCRSLSQVHCDSMKDQYDIVKFASEVQNITPIFTRFKDGKVYEISFTDGSYYVGETTQTLEERLEYHLMYNETVIAKKKEMIGIKLLANIPCENHLELMKYETRYIQQYYRKYGTKILNKKQLGKKQEEEQPKKTKITISKPAFQIKKYEIKHEEKDKRLFIKYTDAFGEVIRIRKRYKDDKSKEEAMKYMENERKKLIDAHLKANGAESDEKPEEIVKPEENNEKEESENSLEDFCDGLTCNFDNY